MLLKPVSDLAQSMPSSFSIEITIDLQKKTYKITQNLSNSWK